MTAHLFSADACLKLQPPNFCLWVTSEMEVLEEECFHSLGIRYSGISRIYHIQVYLGVVIFTEGTLAAALCLFYTKSEGNHSTLSKNSLVFIASPSSSLSICLAQGTAATEFLDGWHIVISIQRELLLVQLQIWQIQI